MTNRDTAKAKVTAEVEPDGPSTEKDPVVEAKKAPPKFDKKELITIFDEMMFSGEYSEDVTVKNRLKVTFKSRSVSESTAITKDIDAKNFVLISSLSEHRALLNLAYSLTKYNGKVLSDMTIEKRQDFISGLPAVIAGALSEALVKFDEKIGAACQEGEENF